jgi:hypothetical protein
VLSKLTKEQRVEAEKAAEGWSYSKIGE